MKLQKTINLITAALFVLALPVHASSGKAHWTYEGHEGPENWGDLSPDYHLCKDGKHQSPIDIKGAQSAKLDKIKFSYKASAKEIINNGHSIQVNMNKGSSITVGGKTYSLLQFHFHSPSEHTFDGKPADMVAHFVHQAKDGQLGVVAVSMKKGKANKTLASLWKHMPAKTGEHIKLSDKLNINGLMPHNKTYDNYQGSLTTPPCSEGVNWIVLTDQIEVSTEQVAAFTNLFPISVRPVQPLNDRVIQVSK
jgi:carbonic anhydrase